MKKEKAITLISLVITIVILIILASVAIFLSLGNNGIFNRAKEAKEATNKQTATEIINLKITEAQVNKYAEKQENISLQELADVLYEDDEIEYIALEHQTANKEKITVGNSTSIFTKLKKYSYEFEINSSLQLASINGVKLATNPKNEAKLERKVIDTFYYVSSGKYSNYIDEKGNKCTYGTLTYDISEILPEHYKDLTRDNFTLDLHSIYIHDPNTGGTSSGSVEVGITTYEDGILTVNLPWHMRFNKAEQIKMDLLVYYIK